MIVLLAFEVEDAETLTAAQEALLPALQPVLERNGGPATCWWVAEDDRIDGSDCDSAVFVKPGFKHEAALHLHRAGYTEAYNVPEPYTGPLGWEPRA